MESLKETLEDISPKTQGENEILYEVFMRLIIKRVGDSVLEFDEVIDNIDYTQNPEDIKILLKSWRRKIFGDWEE